MRTLKYAGVITFPIYDIGPVPVGTTAYATQNPFGYTLDATIQYFGTTGISVTKQTSVGRGFITRIRNAQFYTNQVGNSQSSTGTTTATGTIGNYLFSRSNVNDAQSSFMGNAYLPDDGSLVRAFNYTQPIATPGYAGVASATFIQEVSYGGIKYAVAIDSGFGNAVLALYNPVIDLSIPASPLPIKLPNAVALPDASMPNSVYTRYNIPDYVYGQNNMLGTYAGSLAWAYWFIDVETGQPIINQKDSVTFDSAAMNALKADIRDACPTPFGFLCHLTSPIVVNGISSYNILIDKSATFWYLLNGINVGSGTYTQSINYFWTKIDRYGVFYVYATGTDGKVHIGTSYNENFTVNWPQSILTIPNIQLKCFNPCAAFQSGAT